MTQADDDLYDWTTTQDNATSYAGLPHGGWGNGTRYEPGHPVFLSVVFFLYPAVYVLLAGVGFVGNVTVLHIIRRHPDMQTVTNYFIANLAITDIATLLLCTIPTALCVAGLMQLTPAICKAMNYIQFVTVQATCCTLTAMSVDRYNLIVHAVRSRESRTTRKVVIINAAIWIVSFLVHSPVARFSTITQINVCETFFNSVRDEKVFHTFATLSMYLMPLSITLLCYVSILRQVWTRSSMGSESVQAQERSIRRKRRITRMVFLVVLLFAICWAPAHVLRMWKTFDYVSYYKRRNYHFPLFSSVEFLALCLAYSNSCVNPFVYAFTTTSFKKYFKKVFRPCCRFKDGQQGRSTSMNPSTSRVSKVITREESSV